MPDPAAERGRVDVVNVGRPERPLAVLIAGWKARFIFEPLIERLPPEIGIVVISLYPSSVRDFTAIIDDIPGRARFVDEVLDSLPPGLAGRPLALLGFSRAGLVAHEVAHRRSGRGEVLVHVFVDTVHPGEEEVLRRPTRSRRDTYTALVRSGQFDVVGKRLRNAAGSRARRTALRLGIALLERSGVGAEQVSVPGPVRPLTERDYAPAPVDHPVLIYRASLSDPARTTERWREVVPHLEEVVVEGQHTGDEGVLGRQRIDQVADDLSRRLVAAG